MKRFVNLIERMYNERYSVVTQKILSEKIPIAIFSLAAPEVATKQIENFQSQGANVSVLLTSAPPLWTFPKM